MKEVILHIGIHKTGSSSIQESLRGYDDGETRYARFKEVNHSIPMYTIFSKDRHNYHIWKKEGFSAHDIDIKRRDYISILESDIREDSRDRLVISGEDISNLKDDEKASIMDFFQERNIDIKLVCFVRSFSSISSSMTQGLIGQGVKSVKSLAVNYSSRLGIFFDRLPADRIVVVDYDEVVLKYGGSVEAFTSLAGMKSVESKSANVSRTEEVTKLLYRLNRLPLKTFGSPKRMRARRIFEQEINKKFSFNAGGRPLNKDVFLSSISDDIAAEVLFLKDKCHIEYQEIGVEYDPERVERYLNDLSSVDRRALNEVLVSNGIDDMGGEMIGAMLIELYLKILHSI